MLASLIFGVYSSVFVVFFLLLLHFATFWASATKQRSSTESMGVYIFAFTLVTSLALCLVTLSPSHANSLSNFTMFNYLWQDFFFFTNVVGSMTVQLLHNFFFHFFVFETILLNFYLFFSLILAIGLLFLFRLYANLKPHAKAWGLGVGAGQKKVAAPFSQTASVRIRQINKFRRQTRRQNSSIIRYR